MQTNYHKKLIPVIRYLEKNFNQPLNLNEVASMACLSAFHFHRIFKIVTNETLADYIRRLKLTSAAQTLFNTKQSVTEVALDHGFSSSQSLAKAFKNYFGLTPTEIKRCSSFEQLSTLLKNSKIGHTLSKPGHENTQTNTYTDLAHQLRREPMKTEQFEARTLAYIRVTGPYGENYQPNITKIYQWAGAKNLAGGESIFIYHDNPDITPVEKCRTDICISVPSDTEVIPGIELQTLPAGGYASIRRTVTDKTQYGEFWEELLTGIIESGLETDERPCFELYHSYDQQTDVSDVSFYTAIKV